MNPLDRNRPYNGQPWTAAGVRGSQLVEGLTMRDIRDCLIMAMVDSTTTDLSAHCWAKERLANGTLSPADVYELDFSDIDPIAITQSLTCRIEMAMGIFPNAPKLTIEEVMAEVPVIEVKE